MIQRFSAGFFLVVFLLSGIIWAEQLDTYQQLREWTPYFFSQKHKLYSSTRYEFSRINIGSRKIEWNYLSQRFLFTGKKITPFLEFANHDRDRNDDYTVNFGAYLPVKSAVFRAESGFGMDAEFIYRFQTTIDAEYPLGVKGLQGKQKLRYLHYELSDVMIVSPVGLTYYFGDHYVTADYNFSVTEARGDAHWASAKMNYVLHPRLHAHAGFAAGQRLFDIFTINAGHQESFIFFGGFDLRMTDNIQASFGYSYSEEQPSFIKRSFDAGLSFKF